MSRGFSLVLVALLCAAPARASGLLVPADKTVPPLALVRHEVNVKVVEQVATTEVTQVFRNHTDRPLEATFIFPVPKGASVNRFAMWIDGKEVKGEMVEADKARQVYTEIVRRTQDPGLLEYIGTNLLQLRVFPVPASGEQKLTLSFTAVCQQENGLVEYTYPLKTDQRAAEVLQKFTLNASVKSQGKVHNVYSPTHSVKVTPKGDHESLVSFECERCVLDKDFQLFFAAGDKDVGLTTLTFRPDEKGDGYFLLLVSPRAELAKTKTLPRDMVFVLDTSGSMAGAKMEQAKKAVKFCLDSLRPEDSFTVLNFASSVDSFAERLSPAGKDQVSKAKAWVDSREATGGTAIDAALNAALDLRPKNGRGSTNRTFTVVFFTDGQPTVGETNPENIVKRVTKRNDSETRIFTFGVGDDVNAAMLDRLAEETRSASAYVRPQEDIEVKVSGLYGKISNPVLTGLKLSAGKGVTFSEIYPGKLPDLFHGGQLVISGRYKGHGHTALTLSGKVDREGREFVYEVSFPKKTGEEKSFVENLWARRKVGFLLDQIRVNGQKKELVDEVVTLAKKHGITTPYTSYLVVPDTLAQAPPQLQMPSDPLLVPRTHYVPHSVPSPFDPSADNSPYYQGSFQLYRQTSPAQPQAVQPVTAPAGATSTAAPAPAVMPATAVVPTNGQAAPNTLRIYERGGAMPPKSESPASLPTAGKEGVDFALELKALQAGDKASASASRRVAGRNCLQIAGAWIDDGYKPDMKTVSVRAQSEAYFRLLERRPELKEVFQLGNRLAWVTPSGTVLLIEPDKGSEKMTDADIDALFKKK